MSIIEFYHYIMRWARHMHHKQMSTFLNFHFVTVMDSCLFFLHRLQSEMISNNYPSLIRAFCSDMQFKAVYMDGFDLECYLRRIILGRLGHPAQFPGWVFEQLLIFFHSSNTGEAKGIFLQKCIIAHIDIAVIIFLGEHCRD